ncbi:MAG TPA: hypothetical protein VII93_02565 [Anaerolineales bacterium]
MTEETGLPPAPAPPQKPNLWIIAVVVIVLLCCCCMAALGLLIAFGQPVLNSLGIQSWLPNLTSL